MCKHAFHLVATALLLAFANFPAAAASGSFLPYLNAPFDQEDISAPPKLKIGFGAKTRTAVMDTGSTGIVVSASAIPNFDALPQTPGHLTYSSSGKVMRGQWVTVAVTIAGADGTEIKTKPIPVLAVTMIDCLPYARNCTPADDPEHVSMMGVSFGREYDSQNDGTPHKNPFLNVQADPDATSRKAARRGYIVTRTGVQVGLSDEMPSGFISVKLKPHPDLATDWQQAPVCLSVNDRAPAACGTVLVDTGVKGTYLTLPPSQAEGATAETDSGGLTLAPGTRLSVLLSPQANYHVTWGESDNPLAPAFITLNLTRPTPFINTGVHFLNGFDYLYDADQGLVGYRWTGYASRAFGEAEP